MSRYLKVYVPTKYVPTSEFIEQNNGVFRLRNW